MPLKCHFYNDDPDPPHQETPAEMIERLEKECHCRVDSNGFNNAVVAGLLGAASRALGQHDHSPHDDVVVGTLIQFNNSEEGRRKREADEMFAQMLRAGISPDELKGLFG
jgi:pentatricopeptide repeat protein